MISANAALPYGIALKMIGSSQLQLFEFGRRTDAPFSRLCRKLGVSDGFRWADRFGAALGRWSNKSLRRPIPTLSLFSGAGGLDIAFHDVGFMIETMVEIDGRFIATLNANSGARGYFHGARSIHSDIRKYHPKGDQQFAFIIGGPPCQSFSAAGRRAAGVRGISDERGTLFEEYVRLLKQLKPRGFLFENVYGITGANEGRAWREICDTFRKAGFDIYHRILDSADYGVPQHRERMFIVGTTGVEYRFPRPTHGPDSPDNRPYVSAEEAIRGASVEPDEETAEVGGRFGELLKEIPPGLNYSFFTERMGHPRPIFAWRSKFSDFLYKANPSAPIRTLKAQGGQYTGPFHWDNRPFSVGELKRLQTFPDRYVIVGGKQVVVHQIGNSVPPQIGRILALTILNQLFDVTLPHSLPLLDENENLGFRARKRQLTISYRAAAEQAINGLESKARALNGAGRVRHYSAALGGSFEWLKVKTSKSGLRVKCSLRKSGWVIDVDSGLSKRKEPAFRIGIKPLSGMSWAIDAPKVVLQGDTLEREVFTGAWKAFENELVRLHIKADLVQLCGYYQYKPSFNCTMELRPSKALWMWRSTALVVEGKGIGQILAENQFARNYSLTSGRVQAFAKWLRYLGYEVRNHHTNPQIPERSYLVPYAFPTLNPMSVQLRKSLAGESDDKSPQSRE